jgi:hypothetical protein
MDKKGVRTPSCNLTDAKERIMHGLLAGEKGTEKKVGCFIKSLWKMA